MAMRTWLKNRIFEAWRACIEIDYIRQRINSERSLQASFWAQLNQRLPDTRRLFIEPPMKIRSRKGTSVRFPDIVICNTREVVAIIELKYLPRTLPRYEKDVKSLASISRNRHRITISNFRYRGEEVDGKEYGLSENILFVWAGVHSRPRQEIVSPFSQGYRSLQNCFVQLHAETRADDVPLVYMIE